MTNRTTIALLAGALVLVVHGQPRAQTPDGETPAEESVCDDFSGAAWGLCNAYCEAMDCDGDPRASASACDKVAAQFDSKSGGAALPCECPCDFSAAGLVAALDGLDPKDADCTVQSDNIIVGVELNNGFTGANAIVQALLLQDEIDCSPASTMDPSQVIISVSEPASDPRFLACRTDLLQSGAACPAP